jgi:uncharacterized protein
MAVYFLDSSALVKRYIAETGSTFVAGLTQPSAAHQLYAARISAVEVVAAIFRRVRIGSLTPQVGRTVAAQFRGDFAALLDVVELSEPVIVRAMDLAEKHAIRGYDAVQLAAAITVHGGAVAVGTVATLVSADDELNAAATSEGLLVENPNRRP